jgi:uncharacterized cupin superfamily protein
MPNIYTPQFDQERHPPEGFTTLRAMIGQQAGAHGLGLSLWELQAGEAAYPYHFHLGDEELVIVLDGGLSLRTPDGWRELEPGEVVSFPIGPSGAHQLVNWTDGTVRFLSFSTAGHPDTVVYPDSHKLGAAERRPGGFTMRIEYDESDTQVAYWKGEEAPRRP